MSVPDNLRYTKDHEWIRVDSSTGRVGITQFAADQLGDIVYVDLPAVGIEVKQFDVIASIESVKAVSDIYAPVSGKVTVVNATVVSKPEIVNSDPFGAGWMFEIALSNPSESAALLSPADYESHARSHS